MNRGYLRAKIRVVGPNTADQGICTEKLLRGRILQAESTRVADNRALGMHSHLS